MCVLLMKPVCVPASGPHVYWDRLQHPPPPAPHQQGLGQRVLTASEWDSLFPLRPQRLDVVGFSASLGSSWKLRKGRSSVACPLRVLCVWSCIQRTLWRIRPFSEIVTPLSLPSHYRQHHNCPLPDTHVFLR